MNTADADVPKFLKAFTLMELAEIEEIIRQHTEKPELRYGQQRLAHYLTEMIFGKSAVEQAEKISEILFGTGNKMQIIASMSSADVKALAYETGSVQIKGEEMRILELIVSSGLAPSNSEAKKLIQSGSLSFNEQKIDDPQYLIKKADLLNGVGLLRKGKKFYRTILA
jgi:tyrosyl-tRNA synthetase